MELDFCQVLVDSSTKSFAKEKVSTKVTESGGGGG